MALFPRKQQVWNSTTINASPTTVTVQSLARDLFPVVIALLDVTGTPTGTTPSMTVTVYAITDSQRRVQIGQFAAVTAALATPQRLVIQNVLEETLVVEAVLTGTTPVFPGVSCNLLFAAPDA